MNGAVGRFCPLWTLTDLYTKVLSSNGKALTNIKETLRSRNQNKCCFPAKYGRISKKLVIVFALIVTSKVTYGILVLKLCMAHWATFGFVHFSFNRTMFASIAHEMNRTKNWSSSDNTDRILYLAVIT